MTRAGRWLGATGIGVTVLLGAPPAWPCDSGGGGSSSHSGGGGGGGASVGDNEEEARCAESTPIVGRSECGHFGRWDVGWLPPIELGLGASVRRFSLDGLHFDGVAQHDQSTAFQIRGDELGAGDVTAVTTDLRVLTGLGRHLYLGVEGQIGGVAIDGATMQRQSQMLTPGNAIYAGGGAVVGVRTSGPGLHLRAELYGGARVLIEDVESHSGACTASTTMQGSAAVLEPRVVAEAWITPYATIGGSVGVNALAERDMALGVQLSLHARAFDGVGTR